MSSTPRPVWSGAGTARVERDVSGDKPLEGLELEGRYELIDLLSKGGMGSVHRARHRQLDRPVAIKFMAAELRHDAEMRQRFTAEARVASALSHPNIVSVTDFGIDPARGYFLVMELLRGHTVRERMEEQGSSLRARVACDIAEQTAWALRYMHVRGIFHCDLKPENIFLAQLEEESRRRNHVKLIDFGLAFRAAGQKASLAGTPPYLAPERLRGEPPSERADIYSLGALFYEMLTGRVPFQGSLLDIVDRQLRGEAPPPPSSLIEEPIEARTDEVVMRAIAPNPVDRPPNVEAFLFELRTLMSMMGMSVRRVSRGTGLRAMRRGRSVPLMQTPRRPTRLHERVPVTLPVTIRLAGATIVQGVTENLSHGGVFIALSAPPPPGSEVELILPLAADPLRGLVVRAIVRWARTSAGSGTASGCGLEWLNPTDSVRTQLRDAVGSLLPS